MDRKTLIAVCMLIFTSLMLASIVGCGGGGSSTSLTSTGSGVQALGALTSTRSIRSTRSLVDNQLNPEYTDAYQIPIAYSVAVSKIELLKGADDTTPYTVFDKGGVDQAQLVDLASGAPVSLGENASYPAAGTYTHVRMTIAYLQTRINCDINDGQGYIQHDFRIYASTVGNVQDGDTVVLSNGEWHWIVGGDGGATYPAITTPRPALVTDRIFHTPAGDVAEDNIVHDFYWYKDTADSPDPYTQVVALPTPIVVPANPSGVYKVTANFDITTSPLIPGSTGTFIWDDVMNDDYPDGDGQFRPGTEWASTGHCGDKIPEGTAWASNGMPMWSPLPPTITMSATTE